MGALFDRHRPLLDGALTALEAISSDGDLDALPTCDLAASDS